MIHYKLHCADGHEFEGWFKDSAGFDRLSQSGLVECTVCGNTAVKRALMAPAVVKRRSQPAPPAPAAPDVAAPATSAPPSAQRLAAGPIPAQVIAILQRLRVEIESKCDYVGRDFADEARRIHHGEAELRGIYGEATDAEAEALADDGIEVARIPWVPPADS